MEQDRSGPRDPEETAELDRAGHEQTWGQGVGEHEATIPDDAEEPKTYVQGERADLDDPDLPLARENEGMNR